MLPRDTAHLLESRLSQCSNIGLRLNKFVRANFPSGDKVELGKIEPVELPPECKDTVKSYIARWQQVLDQLNVPPFHIARFAARPTSRFVVGLGAAHVQEVSITLHRIFGFPIIPGNALKGLTRAYVELVLKKTETDAEFLSIFGNQESRGKVVFFDAVPLSDGFVLQRDVMTPHYSAYYQGSAPPADYLKPVPVLFYVVENVNFLFALGSTDGALLGKALSWLEKALDVMGVGAKTTSGYGYFKSLDNAR